MHLNYYKKIHYQYNDSAPWFSVKDVAKIAKVVSQNITRRKAINSKLLLCQNVNRMSTFIDLDSLLLIFHNDPLLIAAVKSCSNLADDNATTNMLRIAYYCVVNYGKELINLPGLLPLNREALDKALENKVPEVYEALLIIYAKVCFYCYDGGQTQGKLSQVANYAFNGVLQATLPVKCDLANLFEIYNGEKPSAFSVVAALKTNFLPYDYDNLASAIAEVLPAQAAKLAIASALSRELNSKLLRNYFEYPICTDAYVDPLSALLSL